MIYRFLIELDIQADESHPWSAEEVARDYLRHILDEDDSGLRDHILEWQIKHVSSSQALKMTEAQRYAALRELLPLARGATVDELIESQARLMAHAKAYQAGPTGPSASHGHQRGDFDRPTQQQTQAERTWHTQQVYQSPQGATPRQTSQEPHEPST